MRVQDRARCVCYASPATQRARVRSGVRAQVVREARKRVHAQRCVHAIFERHAIFTPLLPDFSFISRYFIFRCFARRRLRAT